MAIRYIGERTADREDDSTPPSRYRQRSTRLIKLVESNGATMNALRRLTPQRDVLNLMKRGKRNKGGAMHTYLGYIPGAL